MPGTPFYLQLKQRIARGEWAAGQRLPSVRQLVASAGVSYHQVVSACGRLVSEGLLDAQQGRGYFVTPLGVAAAPRPVPPSGLNDPLFKLLQAGPGSVPLGGGWLPAAWRDSALLARAIRRTARLEPGSLGDYGDIAGYLPLRQQLCNHLRRLARLDLPASQVLTTLGATQALDLVLRLLVQPGDVVLVDEPGNGNLIKLIQLAGAQVLGVPRTQLGPDTQALQQLARQHKIKAFVCNSTLHNPTGGSLSPRTAFELVRLAGEHGFWLIEDDVYGDFCLGPRQTLAELDHLERVIYIGSFSKSLSASLRVGFIACAAELIEPLTRLKLLTSVAVPGFCERFTNTILSDGTYRSHIQHIQQQLLTRQAHTQRQLKALGWAFDIQPEGGMFLWVHHPERPNLARFIQALGQRRILLMPGTAFAVDQPCAHLTRLNCAHFSEEVAAAFAAAP
ncbi:aminotransferase class I/II-fold pyridoxal phosphate-dependent enzyme [Pseudomonas sp. NPDC007930]|uniref:aminotransferase-like domain-containing protein n=1 Tax=Pseudomonas sp. NPDC007930 TaxID=3364417 RepID=UPI0036E2FD3F